MLPRLALAMTLFLPCLAAAAQDWTYRVRPGDTLWDLGGRYLKPSISWHQLQAHNTVGDPYQLPPGRVLKFPIAWLRVEPAPARVLAVRGEVQVSGPSSTHRTVSTGMQLPIGSQISTGADASVTLAFADDSHLLLRENSQLLLDQLSTYGATGMVDTRLRLQRGRSSNRVTPARGPASRYIITAPTATSSVRGTVFRVSAGGGQSVASTEVVEGRVQVDNRGGRQMVDPGRATLSRSAELAPSPSQALLPAPAFDEARTRVAALPLLAGWQPVAGAAGYRVEVVRADAPDVLLFARDLADTRVVIDALPAGALRLLVRAVDADGVEGLDGNRDFLLPDGPEPPLTLSPQHGQTLHQLRPRFEWAQVAQADGSVVQVASEPLFLQPLVEQTTRSTHLRTADSLPAGDYFWRVASVDAQGTRGRFGQALPLSLSDAPVDPQLQPAPEGRQLTLRWQAAAEASLYRVQVSRNADFERLLLDAEVDAPEASLKRPLRGGTLYVRVQTIAGDGYAGPFSAPQQVKLPCPLCYGAGAGALLLLLAL